MESDYRYFKRDISWLSFNYRVFMEATDRSVPLFDRIKFLSIYFSNQEEFYRVRVSEYHKTLLNSDSTPDEKEAALATLNEINREVARQVKIFNHFFSTEIIPDLKQHRVILYQGLDVEPVHYDTIRRYFKEEVFPYLQPVLILKNDIVSFLRDSRLYLTVKMYKKSDTDRQPHYAQIKIPFSKVPRFISLPQYQGYKYLMFIDDIIAMNLDCIFPGFAIDSHYAIRVSRDADFSIAPKPDGDLVDEVRKQVKKRKIGNANRLSYDADMPADMLAYICEAYDIPKDQCIPAGHYLTLEDLAKLPNDTGMDLTETLPPPMRMPVFDRETSMFTAIRKRDILIHFPYQSFDYLVRFIKEAANNPFVSEIKLTQYRVAENSEIIDALVLAAQYKKKVTVFVEIKARFDEENNIETAEAMKRKGIRIVYSTSGLKVHAKALLLKLKESPGHDTGESFAFMSTGNFNEKTAKLYSDIGLFTCRQEITSELDQLFNILEGKESNRKFNTLLISQFNMQYELIDRIQNEMELAKQGKPARIILKMNGLQDSEMIRHLYEASQAGVKIDLIVRGINCLVPNQPYSRNIRVVRIIDSYLEHARIWYFHAGGKDDIFISSADWMKRNLNRRIESACPISDPRLKHEILSILETQLQDNTKACLIDEELNNNYIRNGLPPIRSQRLRYDFLKQLDTADNE